MHSNSNGQQRFDVGLQLLLDLHKQFTSWKMHLFHPYNYGGGSVCETACLDDVTVNRNALKRPPEGQNNECFNQNLKFDICQNILDRSDC